MTVCLYTWHSEAARMGSAELRSTAERTCHGEMLEFWHACARSTSLCTQHLDRSACPHASWKGSPFDHHRTNLTKQFDSWGSGIALSAVAAEQVRSYACARAHTHTCTHLFTSTHTLHFAQAHTHPPCGNGPSSALGGRGQCRTRRCTVAATSLAAEG